MKMDTDRLLGCLLGLCLGLLLICCPGGLWLALSGGGQVSGDFAPPPTEVSVEATITEDYLNRTLMEQMAGYPSPWPVVAGKVDVLPGNRLAFAVQTQVNEGLRLTFEGIITLAAQDGQLVIRIRQVRCGLLDLTSLMKQVRPEVEAQVNERANQQLRERAGRAGLTLVGVSTDDQQATFYLR